MTQTAQRQTERSTMRRRCLTERVCIAAIPVLICIAIVAASVLIRYAPPALDPHRAAGAPAPDASYLYKEVTSDYGYSFSLSANLYRQEDGSVNIYFTNPQTNTVSLLCEIRDTETERLYYKSGRLEPGEYVENLKEEQPFENTLHDVTVSVYALEPETYESAGTTYVNLALQPW